MLLRLWIPLDRYIRHFSSTANSKYCWRKNIRIREKSVYTAKLSGFKGFRIQSSHFRFRIQKLRRHDQTGMFSFRIRPLVCKRQNQSGTKTFRIRDESRTISSSVNLVSGARFFQKLHTRQSEVLPAFRQNFLLNLLRCRCRHTKRFLASIIASEN